MKVLAINLLLLFQVLSLQGLGLVLSPKQAMSLEGSSQQELDSIIKRAKGKSRKVKVSASVLDALTGEFIYAHRANDLLVPASVVKIATSLAALKVLGPEYRFPTEIFADRLANESEQGQMGDIYVRGYGDPSLVDERLWLLVQDLRRKGVKEIRDIYLDDSLFINAPGAGGFKAYQAGLSALTLNHNSYMVAVQPTSIGRPAIVSLTPGSPYELINSVKTRPGAGAKLQIKQKPSSPDYAKNLAKGPRSGFFRQAVKIRVSGSIGQNSDLKTFYRTAPDPATYFGAVFRYTLEKAGIRVTGKVLRKETPSQAKLLLSFNSKDLALILRDLNLYSNNLIAGQLVYELGQTDKGLFDFNLGLQRISQVTEKLAKTKDFRLVDGSGLSRKNRLSSSLLARLLVEGYQDFRINPVLLASLSRFGKSGTLKDREISAASSKSAAWAKTGTLTAVSSLAGYLETSNGRRLAFSVIINGLAKADAVKHENRFVKTLIKANVS